MKILLSILIVSLLILAGCGTGKSASTELQSFAKCISDSGATMFGAYWCPHCQNQKKEFGGAWDQINYVECSLPGGQAQTEICVQAKIESYPTWEFSDGSRTTGEMSFGQLAAKTGCKLP
jgi:hypothetical protein